jgi:hypothetical protein
VGVLVQLEAIGLKGRLSSLGIQSIQKGDKAYLKKLSLTTIGEEI